MLPEIGLGELLDLWKYRGRYYSELKEMLRTKSVGREYVTDLWLGEDDSALGLYLRRFMVSDDGFRIGGWSYGIMFKVVKYIEGPWPRIVVEAERSKWGR